MAPQPIGIRYYNCRNAGIGIIIWPQLRNRDNTNEIIWDGHDHSGYWLPISMSDASQRSHYSSCETKSGCANQKTKQIPQSL